MSPEEGTLEETSVVGHPDEVGRPVRIRWVDSGMTVPRWAAASYIEGKTQDMLGAVETVGLWMGENEHVVMVGQSRDVTNGNWMAGTLIYKPCILDKEWLT